MVVAQSSNEDIELGKVEVGLDDFGFLDEVLDFGTVVQNAVERDDFYWFIFEGHNQTFSVLDFLHHDLAHLAQVF